MNNKKNRITVLIALLLMLFTINTNAQQQNREERDQRTPPTFAKLLKDLDANEDGKLSKKEVRGPLKDDFSKIDLNKDGFITEKELNEAPKPKRKERNRKN